MILGELGYLPFSQSGGALLFHLIGKLYEKTGLIITTNLNFSEWTVYRSKDDHGLAGSTDSPLPHLGNRQ